MACPFGPGFRHLPVVPSGFGQVPLSLTRHLVFIRVPLSHNAFLRSGRLMRPERKKDLRNILRIIDTSVMCAF